MACGVVPVLWLPRPAQRQWLLQPRRLPPGLLTLVRWGVVPGFWRQLPTAPGLQGQSRSGPACSIQCLHKLLFFDLALQLALQVWPSPVSAMRSAGAANSLIPPPCHVPGTLPGTLPGTQPGTQPGTLCQPDGLCCTSHLCTYTCVVNTPAHLVLQVMRTTLPFAT